MTTFTLVPGYYVCGEEYCRDYLTCIIDAAGVQTWIPSTLVDGGTGKWIAPFKGATQTIVTQNTTVSSCNITVLRNDVSIGTFGCSRSSNYSTVIKDYDIGDSLSVTRDTNGMVTHIYFSLSYHKFDFVDPEYVGLNPP
jgi:hypothetical protein